MGGRRRSNRIKGGLSSQFFNEVCKSTTNTKREVEFVQMIPDQIKHDTPIHSHFFKYRGNMGHQIHRLRETGSQPFDPHFYMIHAPCRRIFGKKAGLDGRRINPSDLVPCSIRIHGMEVGTERLKNNNDFIFQRKVMH